MKIKKEDILLLYNDEVVNIQAGELKKLLVQISSLQSDNALQSLELNEISEFYLKQCEILNETIERYKSIIKQLEDANKKKIFIKEIL